MKLIEEQNKDNNSYQYDVVLNMKLESEKKSRLTSSECLSFSFPTLLCLIPLLLDT